MPVDAQEVDYSLFDGLSLRKIKMGKETSSHWEVEDFKLEYDFVSLLGDQPHVKH